jgi:hypothetical protein
MRMRLVMLVAALCTPVYAVAQEVNVITLGGFLGQMDGWCEYPGGTYDHEFARPGELKGCANIEGEVKQRTDTNAPFSLGGLLGAIDWVTEQRTKPNPLVVLSGNNQVANFTFLDEARLISVPRDFVINPGATRPEQTQARFWRFWREMQNLKADAIGLGVEDFVRSLRDPRDAADESTPTPVADRPAIFYRWLQRITGADWELPLISSNAVVKLRGPALNTVTTNGYTLENISAKESVGWLTDLEVTHPSADNLTLFLNEEFDGTSRPVTQVMAEDKSTSTKIPIPEGTLRPGRRYDLQAGSSSTGLFFHTHRALTPHAKNPAIFEGFPIVAKTIGKTPILIVSLIDPDLKTLLGSDTWKWTGARCPAAECEIDLQQPAAVMTDILRRAYPPTAKEKPLVLLISSLTDAQTQDVLGKFPEIRFAILPQESQLLGRASRAYETQNEDTLEDRLARRDKERGYSGDQGLHSIVNGSRPQATLLMARPEWIGEVAATMRTVLSYSDHLEWRLDHAEVDSMLVPGAALSWHAPTCDPKGFPRQGAVFCLIWKGDPMPYGSFPSYQACNPQASTPSDACTRFAELFTATHFSTFAGDSLRRATSSELAVIPGLMVDEDAQTWIDGVVDSKHTNVMTRFMLERLVYRSFRMVRTAVSGAELVATLDNALKSANHRDACVVGIGSRCATAIDTKKPDRVLINGRLIDSRKYYAVAMPEGLAQELKLQKSSWPLRSVDAVSAIHQRLVGDGGKGWYIDEPSGADVSARIQATAKDEMQFHAIASSLEFGYANLALDEATNQAGSIKRTEIDFRGISPSKTMLWKANLDFALLDAAQWAVRAVGEVDYKRRTDVKTDQRSLEANQWLAGARFDWKVPAWNRELRAYGGYFREGEVDGPTDYLTARILVDLGGGSQRLRDAPFVTPFDRRPLMFQYAAVGVDLLNAWKGGGTTQVPIDISKIAFQFATGQRYNVPVGMRINGIEQDREVFRTSGAQALLNAYFRDNEATFSTDVVLEAIDEQRDRNRFQVEFNLEPRFKVGEQNWRVGFESRVRWFPKVTEMNEIDNSLKLSQRFRASLTMPITQRFEVVSAYEHQRAKIHLDGSAWYTHKRFDVTFKFPFVMRSGWGWLFK